MPNETKEAGVDAAKFHADLDAVRSRYSQIEKPDENFAVAMEADLTEIIDAEIVPMVDEKNYNTAMDRLFDLYEVATKIGNGRFYTTATHIIHNITDYWTQILPHLDTQQKEQELERFMAHAGTRPHDPLNDTIQHVIVDNFLEPELAERKLELLDEEQERMAAGESPWDVAAWVVAKLRVLESMAGKGKEAEALVKKYWDYRPVRLHVINVQLDAAQLNDARNAINASMKLDEGAWMHATTYMREIKRFYQLVGDRKAYEKQLWDLVTANYELNLEDYRELKSLYSPEEWAKKREKVFKTFNDKSSIADLYMEEGMYTSLLSYIDRYRSLENLHRYADKLVDRDPEGVLRAYGDVLDYLVRSKKTREYYKLLVHELHRMHRLPGGKEFADNMVQDWKKRFKRADLLEELEQY